jgi:hypothetical protein
MDRRAQLCHCNVRSLGSSWIVSLIESLQGLHSNTVDVDFTVSALTLCSVMCCAQLGHWSGRSSKARACAFDAGLGSGVFRSHEGTNSVGVLGLNPSRRACLCREARPRAEWSSAEVRGAGSFLQP